MLLNAENERSFEFAAGAQYVGRGACHAQGSASDDGARCKRSSAPTLAEAVHHRGRLPEARARGERCSANQVEPYQPMETMMKRLCTTVAILTLSAGLAMAQGGGGGSGGGGGGGSASGGGTGGSGAGASGGSTSSSPSAGSRTGIQSGAGSSGVPGSSINGPNNAGGPVPGLSTTQPSDSSTVGRAPGVNPANPQDASRRGNPSDRTLPGAKNPQDMKAFETGTPQIISPEKR